MKFSHPLPRAIFGAAMVGSTMAVVQFATPVAKAADIRDIAKEITVRIDGPVNGQGVSDPVHGMVGLYLGIPMNTFEPLQARGSLLANIERAEAFFEQGKKHLYEQDYESAIEDFNQAIRLNPNYSQAYNGRGLAYHNQGDYRRAIGDYNQAIRLNPEYAIAYTNRGFAYSGQGDYERAIGDYTEAIRLNPDFAIAYNNRGLAYHNQGDLDGAIADYNEVIRLNPEYAYPYYNRGLLYQKQENNRQALADFRKAADLFQQEGNQEWYQNALEKIEELE